MLLPFRSEAWFSVRDPLLKQFFEEVKCFSEKRNSGEVTLSQYQELIKPAWSKYCKALAPKWKEFGAE